jgi:hypothetical protein
MRMMRCTILHPNGLQKLMDYIHTWLNKWRMQVISPK